MKIDAKDRKILFELEQGCRRPLGEIAKAVGVSKQALHYRIERLERQSVIGGFVAAVNFAKLGLINHEAWICLAPISEEKKKEFIENICKNENVRVVGDCAGKFDLLVGILAENVVQFKRIFGRLLEENPGCVKSYSYSIAHEFYTYPRMHFAGGEGRKKPVVSSGEPKCAELDKADRKILSIVGKDARTSVLDIAKKAGISPNTARAKLKGLEKDGVIAGYKIWFEHSKIGLENYEILANASGIAGKGEKELEEFLAHHPYSTFLLKCVGKWDWDVGFDARDARHFQKILAEFRGRFGEHVSDYEVVNILKWEKFTYYPFGDAK